jgi:hypothetical protein
MASKFLEKLTENKQMLHITAEVVVILGVVFYFSSKHKQISSHVEDLSQRLEDRENNIKDLENKVNQLSSVLIEQKKQFEQMGFYLRSLETKLNEKPKTKNVSFGKNSGKYFDRNKPIVKKPKKPTENKTVIEEKVEEPEQVPEQVTETSEISEENIYNTDSDSELDNEINKELEELEEEME